MGTPEDIIADPEERERLLSYFDFDKITNSDSPAKEAMRQARDKNGWGIFEKLSKDPHLARGLTGIPMSPKEMKWSKKDIGKVKSVRTRGASLVKLSATLGRTPNAVYRLIYRLKKKGEVV